MGELLERNRLDADSIVSCIFTLTAGPRRRVPGRRRARDGPQPRAAAVRARDPGPRRAAARHPRAHALLSAGRRRPAARVPRRGAQAPARPRRRPIDCAAMALEFASKVRRIPVYPAADGYASEGPIAKLASNESPYPPMPGGGRGGRQGDGGRQPLPGPDQLRAAAPARRPPRRAGRPDRDRQRVVRHPAGRRRRAARAGRRAGLRLAVVLGLPAPGRRLRRARDRGAGRRRPPPRPRGDAERDHRRHAAGDRLQPEQPDLDRAPARRDRRLRGRRAAPRLRDPRRGLHRVQHPAGPRRVGRRCSTSTRTS